MHTLFLLELSLLFPHHASWRWAQHALDTVHGHGSAEAIQPPLSLELEARLNEFCQAEVELELDNLQPKGLCGAAGNEKRRQFVRRIRSSNRMSNVNSRLSEPETLMHDTGTLGSPLGVALLHQQRIKVSLAARLPRIERRSISIDISRSRAVASSWMQAPSRRDEQVMSVNIHTNHAKIGHPRPNTNNFKVQLRLNTGI